MNKLKEIVGMVAPGIATALGGPAAGIAAKIAVDAIGIDGGDDPEGALERAVMSNNPEVLLRLKTAEQQFKIKAKELEIDLERIDVDRQRIDAADRDSARSLAKVRGQLPQIILATIYTMGFFGLLGALFMGHIEIDPSVAPLANILLGILAAGQAQIMNYFFGSSSGSKEKTEKMQAIQ